MLSKKESMHSAVKSSTKSAKRQKFRKKTNMTKVGSMPTSKEENNFYYFTIGYVLSSSFLQ